jgi:hypothetical protein
MDLLGISRHDKQIWCAIIRRHRELQHMLDPSDIAGLIEGFQDMADQAYDCSRLDVLGVVHVLVAPELKPSPNAELIKFSSALLG